MRAFVFAVMVASLSMSLVSFAEDQPKDPFSTPFTGQIKANSELPKHAISAEGKLMLFADFESVTSKEKLSEEESKEMEELKEQLRDQRMNLYLINRTGKTIEIGTEDGLPCIKLEYEESPGKWVRAQSHAFSGCGNSFNTLKLPDGKSFTFTGYLPRKGDACQVRYAMHDGKLSLSSNAGAGIIDKNEVKRAAADPLSVIDGTFEYVCKVASGELNRPEQVDINDSRCVAIRWLGIKFSDRPETQQILHAVSAADGGTYASEAKRVLEEIDEKSKQK